MKRVNVDINLGGLVILLGVVFIALKVAGAIDWSWWAVTSPFWAPVAAALGFIGALLAMVAAFALVAALVCGAAVFIVWLIERR